MPDASILLRQYQGDLGTPSIGLKGSGYCVERGGLSAVVLGSVTNKVLTHTKTPVLVYR